MRVKVVALWRRVLALAGTIALVVGSGGANATTTLDWAITNISCGLLNLSAGTTVFSECSTPSFSVSALPNETGFLRVTVSYVYTDEGLALATPHRYQTDAFGAGTFANFESAALSARGSGCGQRFCNPPYLSGVGFGTAIFGLNDQPDDLSGTVTFSTFLEERPGTAFPASADLFIEISPTVLSGIPEPGTWALMLCGLVGLALHARRFTKRSAGATSRLLMWPARRDSNPRPPA